MPLNCASNWVRFGHKIKGKVKLNPSRAKKEKLKVTLSQLVALTIV